MRLRCSVYFAASYASTDRVLNEPLYGEEPLQVMLSFTSHRLLPTWRHRSLLVMAAVCTWFWCLAVRVEAQCSNPANAIVAENCLVGNPSSEWDLGAGSNGDLTLQGFATDISVNQGGTVSFKISTPASAYTIIIYRIGYYGGNGARKVATITPSATLPQTQPACMTDISTGLIDCGNWAVSASWQVPATATSGVYFAHLIRKDTGGDSHIVFIVRNDASTSDVMYQTSDESWQAYNYYGAGSLYSQAKPVFDLTDRSYKVSYNRPFLTRGFNQEWDTWIFGAEFAMIQWLEENGYDVTYFTGVDADRNGSLIKRHKVYMDSGHDEYWTGQQRANVQAARDAGVNLAFFSGNTMFWKTRWENSIDGTSTPDRTLVCYKETLAFAKLDTQNPTLWTGTFRDPSFSPPADGGIPENALTGTLFIVNGTGTDNDGSLQIRVPAADGKMRFWRNTAAATLAPTATYTLPKGTLGYEFDLDIDNGFRPAGAFDVSTATYPITTDYLLDYGATYGAGTATHHLMLYRAPSGALVFSSGTIDWSWGLNSSHDNLFGFASPAPDVNMQQATVNLFADMGVQPATAQPGLVPATRSSDTIAPTSSITYPTSTTMLNTGAPVTVTGTATDSGGVVAGVEVSGDSGATWHPATGRSAWSYVWTPSKVGSTTLLSRAVDDSANLETPGSGVTVNLQAQVCPCTIWNAAATPTTIDSGDPTAIEVGLKFRADSDGSVIGVRFYKSAQNTGTHIGHIWTDSGTLLGTATFTGESSSGWQQVSFSSPIPVTANTTYVVSYYAPKGHYAGDSYFFQQAGVDDPPLHALANGVDGSDGVFVYPPSNTAGGFPSSSNAAANYWVDVVYTSSNTFGLSGTISGAGGAGSILNVTGAETGTTTADNFGRYSFSGLVNGTYTVTATNPGVSFTPSNQTVIVNGSVVSGVNFAAVVTNPLTISGTVSNATGAAVALGGSTGSSTLTDAAGNFSFGGLLNGSYMVTPTEAGYLFTPGTQSVTLSGSSVSNVSFQGQVCNCVSIWQPSATPALIDSADATPIEVGVKFRTDSPGIITALRFYKAATNVGTHVGHIWTSSGALLGSATFTGETGSGWQQVTLPTPITVAANTTYIASYYAPSGHYSADTNAFTNAGVDAPPLHALANGVDGPNGVYLYTSSQSGGFPTSTYASTNYWVDVLFAGAQTSHLSGTVTGAPGATISLSGGSSASTIADSLGNYSFSVYPGTYAVTPSLAQSAFIPGTQTVSVLSADVSQVNFSVPSQCPCNSIWSASSLPGTIDAGDTQPYELGVKFRADTDGYILGVRFYKAIANTGTHLGHLWSSSEIGGPLSTATFTSESASGWQQVLFSTPVPVSANTTYIASYFAPAGHYSADASAFSTNGVDAVPLHALASGIDGPNGVYTQGTTSALPVNSYRDSNYWVDAIYATSTTHTIGGNISGPGGPGTTVTLSGASAATALADASGKYSFSGLADGSYTLTPSQAGYTFSPGSVIVTLSGAHSLTNNFVAAAPAFSVSGTVVGGPQIVVSLSGTGPTTSVTTDASGTFSFPAVPNGSYTVTPVGAGYSVVPATQTITVNGANVSAINFNATALSYTLSGTIAGGAGATVTLGGTATASTIADASGNYSFTVTNGSYTIVPNQTGLVFTPTSQSTTVSGASVIGANFSVPANCPCDTIWPATKIPGTVDDGDNSSTEVGLKFRSDTAGLITGLRFYKGAANTGVHQGNLWSSTGTLLATATFTGESSTGWQQVFFTTPVSITANTTYVASYFAPVGHYAGDPNFFTNAGVDAPPLHALAEGVDGSNGIFLYAAASAFPTTSFNSGNYWVDVIFEPSFTVTGTIGGSGNAGTTVTLSGSGTATTTADVSGNYSFAAVPAGSYGVTPNNTGVLFTPVSQAITVTNANLSVSPFTATPQTFTLSGVISGSGGNGATISLAGTSAATTTASGAGAYSFSGLANGSYTVTPANSGATFTPLSQAVTISTANATANFSTAAPQTFTLSGVISGTGGNGAAVNLTGAATAATTASSTGAYSFSGLSNGSYAVTPTKSGFAFTPSSQPAIVNGANASANFSTAVPTFTLSGVISGVGGNGATVSLTGASTATTTASSTGAYSFPGVANGSYTVTPGNAGFVFTPTSRALTVKGANLVENFSSAAQTFTLSGVISGTGGNRATVSLSGAATATTTASSSGAYTFSGLPNGSYAVMPAKSGYMFTPANQAVTLSGANATANFSSAMLTFTLSGVLSGAGGSGATINLSGTAKATTTASSAGAYTFTVPNGSYTVTPVKAGYVFTPTNQVVTVSGANTTANFASAVQTFTLAGVLSGNGGNGAKVSLGGAASATTTASSSGAYSFPGLLNGTYTIAPTNIGYAFSPASRSLTLNGANVSANFSSTLVSISGTLSGPAGPSATVTLSGAATATVTASSSGTYTFPGLANGTYTVTPTQAGYSFTVPSQTVTISGGSKTVNFTTTLFTISGTISGTSGSGATVQLSGAASATTKANSSGKFSFTSLANGTYIVTPSNASGSFAPASRTVIVNQSNVTTNFVGTP